MRDNRFVMRIKKILSLIAFFAAFAVSTSLVGLTFDSVTAERVSTFIEQDVQNGTYRDMEVYRLNTNSNSSASDMLAYTAFTADYVNKSGSMDESALPQDFQLAWLKHMRAWHNFEDLLKNNQNSSDSYQFKQLYREYNNEITVTWYEVLRVSKKYGATIPADAY